MPNELEKNFADGLLFVRTALK